MRPGQIRYGLVCNDGGGILDDVLVYRLAADEPVDDDTPTFQVVVNATNRAKIVDWFGRRLPDYATRLDDVTTATAMIAVQGPRAVRLVAPLVDCDLADDALLHRHGDAVRRRSAATSAAPATPAKTAARSSVRRRARPPSGKS